MKRTKESKKRLNSLILLVAFSAILLIASTYAWFSTQRDVTISNLEGKVEVAEGLEISLDANLWSQELDFATLDLQDDAYGDGSQNKEPSELLPVSTLGTAGGSIMEMWRGTASGTQVKSITVCDENETVATEADYPGYFAFDIFLKNSSRTNTPDKLHLTNKSMVTVLQEGNKFSAEGKDITGLQNTVRVALALYDGTAETIATQEEVLTAVNASGTKVSKVAIWEPNSNFHVKYAVDNNNKLTVPEGFAGLTSGKFTRTSKIATYAILDDVTEITNMYDWTATTKVAKQNALQTTITVPEATASNPNPMPTSYAMVETNPDLVEASNGTTIFTLPANTITKARVYIWLEGQDVDCINYASHGGGIEINLGIEKPSTRTSGS